MSVMEAVDGPSMAADIQLGPPASDPDSDHFRKRVRAALANRVRTRLEDPWLTCAAVLIPLLYRDGEWRVLVTARTEDVEHHKGQISFPGGACDPEDATLEATALREAYEEIGLPPEAVEVLGALDDFPTVTDFVVTPVVGIVRYSGPYRLNQAEVAALVEVPLSFLREPGNLRIGQVEYKGEIHDVLVWDYGPYSIWGATARMLKALLDLLV